MRWMFYIWLTLQILTIGEVEASEYIGSASCKNCHETQFELWQLSDHRKAMQSPDAHSVLGDFDNKEVTFHQISTRFFRENKQYLIETLNKEGKKQIFPVRYTFGHFPLQQYILETGNGHMQAFNIAWDTRVESAGGQRWYHLQPEEPITPEHPFFWQRHFQNWNSRCAECHTTGYNKGYQSQTNSFDTQFAEKTVGCESCHGPAKTHQQQAISGKLDHTKGFTYNLASPPIWSFAPNDPIANLVGTTNLQYMQQCAACHSRRLPISKDETTSSVDYHNHYQLDLLSTGSYFDDGQINDEVFVIGSFLQSKMAKEGVTCSNCHNPHSGKLKLSGNQTCTQCHSADAYDTYKHVQHPEHSTGAQCVNCHMPINTYMQVDGRRDHSFVIPNVKVSTAVDSPSPCLTCHQQQTLSWVAKSMKKWPQANKRVTSHHWSNIHLLDEPQQVTFAAEKIENVPAITAAKLIEVVNRAPSQASITLALQQLAAEDPMLRRSAIGTLRYLPAKQAYQYLYPLLKDPVKSVRFSAAAILASWLAHFPKSLLSELSSTLDEYRATLMVTEDYPTSQLNLGQLALNLGNNQAAKQHYEQALAIAPNQPLVMLAYADFWRQTNNQKKEQNILKKAVELHQDFADVLHQYGLFWVRKKDYINASKWLEKASYLKDSQPYYAYVAATALDSINQSQQAVKLLLDANKRWPKQLTLLQSLAVYAQKTKNITAMKVVLKDLQDLQPDDPRIEHLKNAINQQD